MVGTDLKLEERKPSLLLVSARACFADMRITHPAHFDTFIEAALVGFVAVKDWRNKVALVPVSNIFTDADEAFNLQFWHWKIRSTIWYRSWKKVRVPLIADPVVQ